MIDMTEGSVGGKLIRFSLPMLLGSVFQQMYNVADSVIVGRFIGKSALAAVGASFPVMFLLIALMMGLTMGTTVLVAQYLGARKNDMVKKTVETAYIVLALSAFLVAVTGLVFDKTILQLLNTPAEVLDDAVTYLDITFAGAPLLFAYNSISAIMRGFGDSKTPLYLLIASTLLNIVLVCFAVIVLKTGIAGAAGATVVAQGAAFFGGMYYLKRRHPVMVPRLKELSFDKDVFSQTVKIGLPSGVQQMLVAGGMMALTRIVNGFGPDATAAFAVAGRVDSFALMPAMNISMALSTFVGQNIGAGKNERVLKGVVRSLQISSLIAIISTSILIPFGDYLIRAFTTDSSVVHIGHQYLIIVAGFYIAFSAMFVYNGALRGAGDTVVPMFVTLFSLWLIRVPASTILSHKWGTNGIWWGIPVAWVIGAICAALYFYSGRWKRKSLTRQSLQAVEIRELTDEIECLSLERKECRE